MNDSIAFTHLVFSLALTSITTVTIGLVIYFAKRPAPLGRVALLYCLSIGWWSFFELLLVTSTDPKTALIWSRVMQAGDMFVPVLFCHFVIAFLGIAKKTRFLQVLYSIGCILAVLSTSPLIYPDVGPGVHSNYFGNPGALYPAILLFFASCVVWGLRQLYIRYSKSTGIERSQVGYVFGSSLLGYIGGSGNFLYVFDLSVPLLNPYGTYAVPIFAVGLMTYAILRYRLMDIHIVVRKSATYLILICGVIGLVGFALFLSDTLISVRLYSYPGLIMSVLYLLSAGFVLAENPQKSLNRVFALFWTSVVIWLFGCSILFSARTVAEAVFWSKLVLSAVIFIPTLFFHFTTVFLAQSRAFINRLNYLISFAFLFMLWGTDRFMDGVYHYSWGYYPKTGLWLSVFLAHFLFTFGWGLLLLYKGWRQAERVSIDEANRRAYVFLGMSIAFLAATDFLPAFGWDYYPQGYLAVGVCLVMIMYAILRHQLMDIRIAIRRGTIYGLSLIGIYSVILIVGRIFWGTLGFMGSGVMLLLFVVFAGILYKTVLRLEEAVGKTIFKRQYRAYETLEQFSRAVVTILNFDHLTGRIVQTLVETLGLHHANLYLFDAEPRIYRGIKKYPDSASGGSMNSVFGEGHFFPRWLKNQNSIVVREEIQLAAQNHETRAAAGELGLMEAEVCIPLLNKDRLIGFCNLGQKTNREMYTDDDLKFLSTLAQQAAIALDNARLYEDLKRSRFLMMRTDRLKSLETVAGGFAHEIRNPLTSIKTFVELAVDRRDDPEFMSEFAKIAREDVLRIERLIREILDYARQKDRHISSEDINEVVSSSSYFMRIEADKHKILFQNDLADNLPRISMDRQQIRQVFLNLYLNAIDALGGAAGTITTRTKRFPKDNKDWLQVSVSDTGCGIPPEQLNHIFDPFFTTKHESSEREGTGLGLSIVHQIVEDHGGFITVESIAGQGTTFTIHLPVISPVEVEIGQ